ncbi:hypothetical protein M758_5G037600 [Ceratodon purpureus]|uniref:Uncharacterized protein n=1 Tax=Ceratodon purpureus TaxID=3225 RepID=A0A8T0HYE1_CERPU|nr:hypothetical protein KC19_5G037600 [Ceratodon purpureus]KAG0615391.1 hypothetical protein M758_5G037600 [Ceratodon purpureus]
MHDHEPPKKERVHHDTPLLEINAKPYTSGKHENASQSDHTAKIAASIADQLAPTVALLYLSMRFLLLSATPHRERRPRNLDASSKSNGGISYQRAQPFSDDAAYSRSILATEMTRRLQTSSASLEQWAKLATAGPFVYNSRAGRFPNKTSRISKNRHCS